MFQAKQKNFVKILFHFQKNKFLGKCSNDFKMIHINLTIYLKVSVETRDWNFIDKSLLTCHKFNIDHKKIQFFFVSFIFRFQKVILVYRNIIPTCLFFTYKNNKFFLNFFVVIDFLKAIVGRYDYNSL